MLSGNPFWKPRVLMGSLFPFFSLLKMSCMSFGRLTSLWLFKIITEVLIAEDTQTQPGEVF